MKIYERCSEFLPGIHLEFLHLRLQMMKTSVSVTLCQNCHATTDSNRPFWNSVRANFHFLCKNQIANYNPGQIHAR